MASFKRSVLLFAAFVLAPIVPCHAENLGPEGGPLASCYTRVDWARDAGKQHAAIHHGEYYEIAGADATKLMAFVNAQPPVTDAKADLWLVEVDGETIHFARTYQGCVELFNDTSKDFWDGLIRDAIGDAT